MRCEAEVKIWIGRCKAKRFSACSGQRRGSVGLGLAGTYRVRDAAVQVPCVG